MLVRAPKLNSQEVLLLQVLLRIDYRRALAALVAARREDPDTSTDQLVAELEALWVVLHDYEVPLTTTSALLDATRSVSALVPMDDRRYNFYASLLNIGENLVADDVPPEVEEDLVGKFMDNVKLGISQLKPVFQLAETIDTEAVHGHNHQVSNSKFLN